MHLFIIGTGGPSDQNGTGSPSDQNGTGGPSDQNMMLIVIGLAVALEAIVFP